MSDRFPDADVPITLTGREWTALLARIDRPEQMNTFGMRTYRKATEKLGGQLLAAQARINGAAKQGPPSHKVYIMTAGHFSVPGMIVKVCDTHDKAVAEGIVCTNIMISDHAKTLEPGQLGWRKPVDTEEMMTAAVNHLQDWYGAAYCYVEIDEHEVL